MSFAAKFSNAREQGLDEKVHEPKALAAGRPVVGEQRGFYRDRIDAFAGPNDVRVIFLPQAGWKIVVLHLRRIRDRQKMNAIDLQVAR